MLAEKREIGIIGNGGQANEAESYLEGTNVVVAFRAVDAEYLDDDATVDVANPAPELTRLPVVIAIGAPLVRREMVSKWPGSEFYTVTSQWARVNPDAKIGDGSIIAPGAIVTTNGAIGKHCIVNIGATVSHDVQFGDFVTVCPGVNVAGDVQLDDGVFLGIGAAVSNDVYIAPGVVVGAGAVVIEDIEIENAVVAGVPARVIGQNEEWLRRV